MTRHPHQQEHSPSSGTSPAKELVVERYKSILLEIHTLNENFHKFLTLFQTLTTAIVGAGVAVFVGWKQLKVTADVAKTAVNGLLVLLWVAGLYVILTQIAGICSWYDYRREEAKLLNAEVKPGIRDLPRARNFWRWHETYFLIFTLLVVIGIHCYVARYMIPQIK